MKILTLGDSHCRLLGLTNELKEINSDYKGITSEVLSFPGATITGFGKRESTLNTSQAFINKVNAIKPDCLCFALGQVDIELGYYYKKVIKGDDIEFYEFSDKLLDKYIENTISIAEELSYSKEKVIFKGVNLPVLTNSRAKAINYTSRIITENINEGRSVEEYRSRLSQVFPSNIERAYYHKAFNEDLEARVTQLGMRYFDVNTFIEDKKNRCSVDLKFIPAGNDHHLIDSLYMRKIHINSLIHTVLTKNNTRGK